MADNLLQWRAAPSSTVQGWEVEGGSDAWAWTPNPHERMQKVEWECRVPSHALQMSGISLNDAKCQTLSLLQEFLCWAEQPFLRFSTESAW